MALLIIVFTVLVLDQSVKYLVAKAITENTSLPVLGGALNLTHIQNPGAAFGLLPDQRVLFYVVTFFVLLVLVIFYAMANERSKLLTASSGLIIGGALGNLIDRLLRGTVTDYIDLKFWPVFNIADIAVVCGFALFAYLMIRPGSSRPGTDDGSSGSQGPAPEPVGSPVGGSSGPSEGQARASESARASEGTQGSEQEDTGKG